MLELALVIEQEPNTASASHYTHACFCLRSRPTYILMTWNLCPPERATAVRTLRSRVP